MELRAAITRGVSFSLYFITCILLLLCIPSNASRIRGDEIDRLSLLEFKANLKDPLGAMRSWNNSIHVCRWHRVICHPIYQRVVILNLSSQNISGIISPHIGNLSFLMVLNLQRNMLYSGIPPEVGRLSSLEYLLLNNNTLSGDIPPNLSNCSALVSLGLGGNMLGGELPKSLGSLTNLELLYLLRNKFTGGIPLSFGNLTSLVELRSASNNFTGSIPYTLGNLRNLQLLALGNNHFSGTIPPSIFNNSAVKYLDVAINQLEGVLPWDLGFTLPNLLVLNLVANYFTGPIPESISNMSSIQYFQVVENSFTGNVPSFQQMSQLFWFNIDYNHLGGRQVNDLTFLCSFTNSTNLRRLGISNNNFRGAIPKCIGNLSVTLVELTWSSNYMPGSLPSSIGNLINLERLLLEDSFISGVIPWEIGNLKNLKQLRLGGNKLSGQIPESLGNLRALTELSLRNNSLWGRLPSSISNCKSLLVLDVANNKLTGNIPSEITSLSALSICADFSHNGFSGTIPLEVGNLRNLGSLNFSDNNFSSEIPSSLGSCTMLEYLYMQNNRLEGSIPSTLSSLKGIRQLKFSNNKLSGQIPQFLAELSLESLDLSFNEFEGALPEGGIFKNASAVSVVGNGKLCGGLQEFQLPKCNIRETKKKGTTDRIRIVVYLLSGLLGMALVLSFLYVLWFRKKKSSVGANCSSNDLWKVSYNSLLKATDGFSSANLIGQGGFGSVYKGVLDSDQTTVAIKVLNLTRHGASKCFLAECEALRNIRHRNIVKVLTACSGIDYRGNDFKALVYQFMNNGTLDEWLHPEDALEGSLRQLDVVQRLDIAVHVACALDYLHHGVKVPIVHCDLKPSNILLDEEMVAHVGDFGLVRFLQEGTRKLFSSQSSSRGVKGSFGYIPPEYGAGGGFSTYGDVYSYGILILEMFTGKRPTDEIFVDGLSLHSYAAAALPDGVSQIVDPVLQSECTEPDPTCNRIGVRRRNCNRFKVKESLVSVVEIGVACSSELPRDRMAITDVVVTLKVIRNKLVGVDD